MVFCDVVLHSEDQDFFVEFTKKNFLWLLPFPSLSNCSFRQSVNNTNARSALVSLASSVTIFRPYHSLLQLGQGMGTYQNLWNGVREEHVLHLYESARPDCTKISDAMLPLFSDDDPDKRTMEERIIVFLDTWMASLNPHQLMEFLVFWTASDAMLPDQVLKIEFNSMQGFARRPTSSTCSDTLSLSRNYFSQEDFDMDMVVVFRDESKVMDAL